MSLVRRGGGLVLMVVGLAAAPARAATVRGSVTVPADPRVVEPRDGYWRVENGVLPIGPRLPDPRSEVVVVLEGTTPPPRRKDGDDKGLNVTIDLHGLRADPRVMVAPVGASILFKNSDRVPHSLFIENAKSLMGAEPTPAGKTREVRLLAAGEYTIHDEEYPHIECTIVIDASPYAAMVDDKGGFKLDVPEGKYTLKVFWHGGWVLTQPLEVGPKTTDIALQVPAPSASRAATPPAPAPAKGRVE